MRGYSVKRGRREIAAATMAGAVGLLLHRMRLFELDIPQPVKDQAERVQHCLTVYNATDKEITRAITNSVF